MLPDEGQQIRYMVLTNKMTIQTGNPTILNNFELRVKYLQTRRSLELEARRENESRT